MNVAIEFVVLNANGIPVGDRQYDTFKVPHDISNDHAKMEEYIERQLKQTYPRFKILSFR